MSAEPNNERNARIIIVGAGITGLAAGFHLKRHHGIDDIPHRTLDPRLETHIHSMYQIKAEFLSDIAEFPEWWIPKDIIESAKSRANQVIDDRFSNDPGWKVGEPRPF